MAPIDFQSYCCDDRVQRKQLQRLQNAFVARIVSCASRLPPRRPTNNRDPSCTRLKDPYLFASMNSGSSSFAGGVPCSASFDDPFSYICVVFLFAFIQKALFLVDIPLWSQPFVTVIAYSLSTGFYIIRGTSPAICLCT